MLKGSRSKDGKSMTLFELKTLIYEIYTEKLTADVIDKKEGRERLPLGQFVAQFLLLRQYTKTSVQTCLWGIIQCTKEHYQEDDWVMTFARFCGLVINALGVDAEETYLWVVKKLKPDIIPLPPTSVAASTHESGAFLGFLSCIGAEMLLETVSKSFTNIQIEKYVEMIRATSFDCELIMTEAPQTGEFVVKLVAVEKFMNAFLNAWEQENEIVRSKLAAVFQSYDHDQSGEFDFEEFREMVQSVAENREFSTHELQRLFVGAITNSDSGTMNPEVFSQMIHDQFRLFMSRDVLDELGDFTSDVNNSAKIKLMFIQGVRNKFNKFDVKGKGSLTRQEMSRVLKVYIFLFCL